MGIVRDLEPGEQFEILKRAWDSRGRVRLRGAEGWTSVLSADGTRLMEVLQRHAVVVKEGGASSQHQPLTDVKFNTAHKDMV